jgi:CSLREA domain-containing protein
MGRRWAWLVGIESVLVALMVMSPIPVAAAALTYTVNRIGDAADLSAGNGKCDSSSASGLQCTLRAAIQEANAHSGADTIRFGITSSSKVIRPTSALPTITEKLTINGYSQSGSSANTLATGDNAVLKIVVDGTNAGASATGLFVQASGVLVKGLVIEHFSGFPVQIRGANNVISGNFIGTQADGVTPAGNGSGVFVVDSPGTTIGGAAAARNVIAGNGGTGITLIRSSNSTIKGNYIGTDSSGSTAIGNTGGGINVDSSTNVTIGGSTAGAGNVISGNDHAGILFQTNSDAATVQGNRIGTSATGSTDLGNSAHGIAILSGDGDTIGGPGAAANAIRFNDIGILVESVGNTISGNAIQTNDRVGVWVQNSSNTITGNAVIGNGTIGVQVTDGTGNRISGNVMSANGALGIDLNGTAGVTPNDVKDPDTGPNGLQNFPVLVTAFRALSGVTTVSGTLNSLPTTEFKVELYVAVADPSGHGEGFALIGSTTFTTNSNGDKGFSLVTAQVVAGQQLTATATRTSDGSTSEFSANALVVQH